MLFCVVFLQNSLHEAQVFRFETTCELPSSLKVEIWSLIFIRKFHKKETFFRDSLETSANQLEETVTELERKLLDETDEGWCF